jgi:hypothetical protein
MASAVGGGAATKLKFDAGDVTEVRMNVDGHRIAFTRHVNRPDELWAYRDLLPK